MQPVTSPGSHDRRGASRADDRVANRADDRAARVRFRRALTLMLMTLVLPGSAQLVAGRREVGRIAIRIWFATLGVLALIAAISWVWHGFALELVLNTNLLNVIRFAMMILAVGWAALFIDAWRLGQPLTLVRRQRLTAVGVNGLLCFTVAGALLFGSHLVTVHRDFILANFGDGPSADPSAGRYNVLLLGGDAGAGRTGLRPDSITVASIDADSGRTVLVGLPRNLAKFRFAKDSVMAEQFPDGFNCDGCYLNGVSTWAMDNTELFGKSKNPGVEATIEAVEGITDLEISYWAMVNLEGFKDVVDAFGGVELTVRQPIPVGGLGSDVTGYIKPGTRTLNGHDALWFARAREGSDDYSRMARQKCVMQALAAQVSPTELIAHYGELTKAGSAMVQTNLPGSELKNFMQLALKAKDQKISTVSIVPPAINTGDPDLAKIKKMVADGIARAEGKGPKPGKKKAGASQTINGGSLGTRNEGYQANESDDLATAC